MAQVYTFTDSNGEVRLMAEINPAPGGSQPVTREEWFGSGVTIAGFGSSDRLTWDTSDGPDALLDNTVPTVPTIITAGVYVVQVTVLSGALNVGAGYNVLLQLDRGGFNADASADSPPATTHVTAPQTSLTLAWYLPAGAQVEVWVTNNDQNDVGFSLLLAHLQRVA